ncbi:sigma 54-interacting transcriptional regulator [bacterium]|nr:sigma 54-interacting transcriptional regulator [bacterium]
MLPGNPERVDWDLEDVEDGSIADVGIETFRRVRDTIGRLIVDLLRHGYLTALVTAKRQADLILNNITEGLMAHDLQRRIFYFNQAAERITEYPRSSVIGQDCHQTFPGGGFCGGKGLFCQGEFPTEQPVERMIEITTRTGERRRVQARTQAMIDRRGRAVGALILFHDLTREHELARRLGEVEQFSGIIGRDIRMLELFDLVRDVADSSASVLIQGESGTGKELVAAAIHRESPRSGRLFVPVNCGALPESLLESELFGHVRGAFSGAIRDKKGRFELADGGTLFLDEIGDVSPAMQVKLLRVLQEGSFERVGSEKTVQVDVRVVSATNKDLREEIARGRFREDLYYRLAVVPITLPPLRERRTDIPLLAQHILKRFVEDEGRAPIHLSAETMDLLVSHVWPGNVRELQNWIQFALVKCKGGTIRPEHLPAQPQGTGPIASRKGPSENVPRGRRMKLSTSAVREALRRTDGNKLQTARILGVGRATLYRFLDENRID